MKTKLYSFSILCICLSVRNNTNAQNANTSLSNLVSPVKINVALLPDKNYKRDLGSGTKAWKNLYLDSAVYLQGLKFLSAPGLWSTATGFSALSLNTGGYFNTANGFATLYNNTSGYSNSAFGGFALYLNTTGNFNSAFGVNALYFNASDNNSAFGNAALYSNTTGYNNSAFGSDALYNNTTGYYNSAFGYNALISNTTGTINSAFGDNALTSNTTGDANSAFGNGALSSNTTGIWNSALGDNALALNTTGSYNSAFGFETLSDNSTGSNNTGFGYQCLSRTTASQFNTAVGYCAGCGYDNGYNNVFIGANVDVNGAGYYNDIAIGQGTVCTDVSQARFGNSATVSIGGYANWSNISDGRVKKNIKQNVPGLAFIDKLQPITYNLDLNAADRIIQYQRKDSTGKIIPLTQIEQTARATKEKILYTGFIAQDVEKAAKSLNYDFSGVDAAKNNKDLYGLRYAEFVVPLVKAVQELSAKNDLLQKQNDAFEQRIEKLESMVNVSNQSMANSQQSTVISSASLRQNTPNPFSNSTTISYTLPQQYTSARIIITDKNGNVLKQINLSNSSLTGGSWKGAVNIDASTLSSGSYQYSLIVNGKMISTKQMELAK